MKNHRRTTVRLDEALRAKLKMYCLERDETMDQVISRAISREINGPSSESMFNNDIKNMNGSEDGNSFYSLVFLDEISTITGPNIARHLFRLKCISFKIPVESFSKEDLSEDYIESFCHTYSLIAHEEKVSKLRMKLDELKNE